MSVLKYNGFTLPCNQTTKFEQVPIYEQSNTDWIGTQYTIITSSLINIAYLDVIKAAVTNIEASTSLAVSTSATDILRRIRNFMLQPRKQLSFVVDGVEQIPQKAQVTGTVDANNGPHPIYFNFFVITADTYLLTFAIKAQYWENMAAVGSLLTNMRSSAVLCNRWTESVSINEYDLSVRRRVGFYKIRSDNAQGLSVDNFRDTQAILKPYPGFLRTKREYEVSEDGLSLHYIIEDEEQIQMPPKIALGGKSCFRANVVYTERSGRQTIVRFGMVSVELRGGDKTNESNMLLTAVGIAVGRLYNASPEFIVLGTAISHEQFLAKISVVIQTQYTVGRKRVGGVSAFGKEILDSSILEAGMPPYEDRGSADITLRPAAYGNPNSNPSQKLNGDNLLDPGKLPGQEGQNL